MNIAGAKRRKVARIEFSGRHVTIATTDCGHTVVRWYHLGVGQTVYCWRCAPAGRPDNA